MQAAITSYAVPATKVGAARHTQLLKCIGDVKFHGVRADALHGSNLTVAQAVSHGLDDSPFARRQNVRVCGAPPLSSTRHARSLSRLLPIFPTQNLTLATGRLWPSGDAQVAALMSQCSMANRPKTANAASDTRSL